MSDPKTLDDLGLEVGSTEVEVGQTYPLLGLITKLIKDEPGNLVVEFNHNIELTLIVSSQESIDIVKSRAFETGIFITEILEVSPVIKGVCRAIIFGRKQTGQMQ